ncbi:unnamed protein product [Parnassius apollo]|uniref:(apollo) hypothetical protein n=1 Tax=Parnassius apollo TaxID=110799 RepID=A0A8S3Y879_PARAO|nr:unnamed protein product [Parnassius apollo]
MGILQLITIIKQSRLNAPQLQSFTTQVSRPTLSQSPLPGPSRIYYEPQGIQKQAEGNMISPSTRQYYEQFYSENPSSNDSQSSYAGSDFSEIDFAN